jgi:hypothetical protein
MTLRAHPIRTLAIFCALLLAVACSSDDGGGGGSGGGSDKDTSTGDAGDTGGDVTIADTGGGSDVIPDMGDPIPPATDAFIQRICDSYCGALEECQVDVSTCVADCLAAVEADPDFLKAAACVDQLESCEDYQATCLDAPILDDPTCVAQCAAAEACGMLPHAMLGANTAECAATCSSFTVVAPVVDQAAVLDCVYAAIDACDGMGVLGCIAPDMELCQESCVRFTACPAFPESLEDQATCEATCGAWSLGEQLAFMGCTQFTGDEDERCDVIAACVPPKDEMAVGADDFCAAFIELCQGTEGFEMYADPMMCGWMMTGLTSLYAGIDFTAAAACVSGHDVCTPDQIMIECLMPDYPPCQGYCEKIDACVMASPEPPEDWPGVEGCVQYCRAMHASHPEELDAAIACVEATDCAGIGVCMGEE